MKPSYIATYLLALPLISPAAAAQERPELSSPEVASPRRLDIPSGGLTPMDGTKQLQLQLVNCNNILDCGLARLLLPKATFIQSRQLQFANPTQQPISLLNSAIVAEGTLTGYQINQKAIKLDSSQTFAANNIGSLQLNLNRRELPPDQYSGTIYLMLADQPEWLPVPMNLSVRSGPLLPSLVLIWGIVLGRLLKYMQERGAPQAKVLQELNELEYEIKSLDPADQTILTKAITQARQASYREQLETAQAKITTIRERLGVLTNLRTLENNLEQRVEPIADDVVDQAIATVQSARESVLEAEDATAKAGLQEVEKLLDSAGASRSGQPSQMQNFLQTVTKSLDELQSPGATSQAESLSFINWLQRTLIVLSGISDRAKAEATFWVVRPLLALVLLAGLSAVGLGSLYVEKGNTFGARPFSDYLGLILWGLSADVASRSLSSLSGQKND